MDFVQRKLPKEEAAQLTRVNWDTVEPYHWMFSPVYVFMRRNEKFISVKAPLDFFDPEELKRLAPYESLYFLPFITFVEPFQRAGRRLRTLLQLTQSDDPIAIPSPYELSDCVLRVLGPIWGARAKPQSPENKTPKVVQSLVLEPFFAAALVEQATGPLNPLQMKTARERDVQAYETAILLSSWVIFLALHLGYLDPEFLADLRSKVFTSVAAGQTLTSKTFAYCDHEVQQLIHLALQTIAENPAQAFQNLVLESQRNRLAEKLMSRLSRVMQELAQPENTIPTIYGERGFARG